MADDDNTYIEDQSDVDNRKIEAARQAAEAALAKRSSAVKRSLPRPIDVNHTVLRPVLQRRSSKILEERSVKRLL